MTSNTAFHSAHSMPSRIIGVSFSLSGVNRASQCPFPMLNWKDVLTRLGGR